LQVVQWTDFGALSKGTPGDASASREILRGDKNKEVRGGGQNVLMFMSKMH